MFTIDPRPAEQPLLGIGRLVDATSESSSCLSWCGLACCPSCYHEILNGPKQVEVLDETRRGASARHGSSPNGSESNQASVASSYAIPNRTVAPQYGSWPTSSSSAR